MTLEAYYRAMWSISETDILRWQDLRSRIGTSRSNERMGDLPIHKQISGEAPVEVAKSSDRATNLTC